MAQQLHVTSCCLSHLRLPESQLKEEAYYISKVGQLSAACLQTPAILPTLKGARLVTEPMNDVMVMIVQSFVYSDSTGSH